MRGASTLIPARFLSLVGHLCVLITLLWENHRSTELCLPTQYHGQYLQIYKRRLLTGYSCGVALLLLELLTFALGLTMFAPAASLISVLCHASATISLTYFVLDGWLCDWYWPLFALCSVLPAVVDAFAAAKSSSEDRQLTQGHSFQPSWSLWLALAFAATTLGASVPVGFHIGVVNTPAEVIRSFCNESFKSRYDIELSKRWLDVLWSSVVSVFIVGGCTGSLIGAVLANTLGRRKATLTTSGLSLIGAALFVSCRAANSVEMLVLGRLIVGLAAGLTTSIVPMYLTELAPLRLSGAMGVACPMGVNVGVLLGQVMGLNFLLGGDDDWPYLLSVYVLLVIVCLPALFFLPESPKYLFVVRKDKETALKELSRLRGVSSSILTEDVELLHEELCASVDASASQWTLGRVLRDPRLRLPLLLVCSMQAGQQTSGINAVFYYSQTIFKSAGLSKSASQLATVGCGAVNVCTAVLMTWLLPRVGRRPLLLGSIAASAVMLAALTVAMKFMHVEGMSYVCMACVLAYVIAYGFGLGPIPYFIASELFEVAPRGAGMAWGSLANWAGNFLVGMCFPLMRDSMGPYSFLVFALVTAALFAFQKMFFPETSSRTPSTTAALCSRGFRSRPAAAAAAATARV